MANRITMMVSDENLEALKHTQALMIRRQTKDKTINGGKSISLSWIANMIMACGIKAPKKWNKR